MAEIRPPELGEVAPDFAAVDTTGERRRWSDLAADRPLVLVFYRGHW
jgi:peroxiredoxin